MTAAMRALIGTACLVLAGGPNAGAAPPSDPRFFGIYCGDADVEHCVTVRTTLFGFTINEREVCRTIELRNIRVRLDHKDTPKGALVSGSGSAQVEGEAAEFVIAGAVRRRGLVRGSATVRGLDPHFSYARLSNDGLELRVSAYAKPVKIRKDACGNQAPQTSITNPADGAVIPFGSQQQFAATVTDPEDTAFPSERQQWKSSRDGAFGVGRLLFTSTLSPGEHVITFSATDSGGLTAVDSIRVTIGNQPPETPTIVQPEPGATVVATGPVTLEGKAFDREDGMLNGQALAWTSRLGGMGPPVPRGFGRQVVTTFADPGVHTLRLTATDQLGSQNFIERLVTVQPFAGNTPPRVTIEIPDHLAARGEIAAAVVTGAIDFVGTAADLEDAASALNLRWVAEPIDPVGPPVEFGAGSTVATVTLSVVGGNATIYRVTFSAIDSGGLIGRTRIKLLVLPSPIL